MEVMFWFIPNELNKKLLNALFLFQFRKENEGQFSFISEFTTKEFIHLFSFENSSACHKIRIKIQILNLNFNIKN